MICRSKTYSSTPPHSAIFWELMIVDAAGVVQTEALERHYPGDHFQGISLRGNRRKPPVRIKKPELPHVPTRESCCHNSDAQ
jgi:hypothetical protein